MARETSIPRPPMDTPPRCPPLPHGCPPRAIRPVGRTPRGPTETDPLQAAPQIKKEDPRPFGRPNSFQDGPHGPRSA